MTVVVAAGYPTWVVPITGTLTVLTIAAVLGAAWAVFRANNAQGLINLLKENVTQLETSRDEFRSQAEGARKDHAQCVARYEDLNARTKVLESLVTGTEAIKKLSDKLDTQHADLMTELRSHRGGHE